MLIGTLVLIITSVVMILVSAGLGIWKVFELVSLPWFIVICTIYFGIILTCTGLLSYLIYKIVKDLKHIVDNLKTEISRLLANLKDKLSKIPKSVWKLIKSLFK